MPFPLEELIPWLLHSVLRTVVRQPAKAVKQAKSDDLDRLPELLAGVRARPYPDLQEAFQLAYLWALTRPFSGEHHHLLSWALERQCTQYPREVAVVLEAVGGQLDDVVAPMPTAQIMSLFEHTNDTSIRRALFIHIYHRGEVSLATLIRAYRPASIFGLSGSWKPPEPDLQLFEVIKDTPLSIDEKLELAMLRPNHEPYYTWLRDGHFEWARRDGPAAASFSLSKEQKRELGGRLAPHLPSGLHPWSLWLEEHSRAAYNKAIKRLAKAGDIPARELLGDVVAAPKPVPRDWAERFLADHFAAGVTQSTIQTHFGRNALRESEAWRELANGLTSPQSWCMVPSGISVDDVPHHWEHLALAMKVARWCEQVAQGARLSPSTEGNGEWLAFVTWTGTAPDPASAVAALFGVEGVDYMDTECLCAMHPPDGPRRRVAAEQIDLILQGTTQSPSRISQPQEVVVAPVVVAGSIGDYLAGIWTTRVWT